MNSAPEKRSNALLNTNLMKISDLVLQLGCSRRTTTEDSMQVRVCKEYTTSVQLEALGSQNERSQKCRRIESTHARWSNAIHRNRLGCDALMTTYEDRSCKAWFEYAEPGLLTNRTIRNFLNSYSQEKWPDAVKLTLLYGIISLRQSMGVAFVPLEKIRQKISRSETAYCVEEKLLPIQEKVQDLKGDVQEILEAFAEDACIPNNRPTPVLASHQDPTTKRLNPKGTSRAFAFRVEGLQRLQMTTMFSRVCVVQRSPRIFIQSGGATVAMHRRKKQSPNLYRSSAKASVYRLCFS